MVLHLSLNDRLNVKSISQKLAELQYQRNNIEFKQGAFRVMGDVIDIFPADSDNEAIRIEMFDDEVENISYFDPLTGEVKRKVRQVTIFPKNTLCYST